ncbi:aspartate transaminase [Pseudomonas sp. TH31]|uniref:aspartate transaminase n=1 Tax=Pseudomonas sp. TH31 TaxID=2796396 RepID=UPI0019134219|nr:aspartate transaminase [Pseudomonas sp. TH31]MBK5416070.1 aspartate transaminase [Pseudomonas sp. TH31]
MPASRIAAHIQRIKTSPNSAAAELISELRAQGRPIINLVVGEPDFPTPAHVCQAAVAAIGRGETRYTQTAGTPALRQAIAAKLSRENGLNIPAQQVVVTCGAKHALFNALAVTLEPGDEVLIPAPYWVSYPDMVLACEGEPVILPTDESSGFKITAQALEAAITPRTRWLILNSPSNPTGATYDAQALQAIAGVLADHPQVMVLTDDIYEHIRFDGSDNPHILALAPQLAERVLVVNGVSKTYAMTGWRIGYAAGPRDLIGAMDMLQSQSTSGVCSISQAAALAALEGDQSEVLEHARIYEQRRDATLALINAIPGLQCRAPGGAFYLFVNCSGALGRVTPQGKRLQTDIDLTLYFLETVGVALAAGTGFGCSPYFRMTTATDMETLREGCGKIAEALALLR